MSRIAQRSRTRCVREGRKALIPYVTAGDPYADATADVHARPGRRRRRRDRTRRAVLRSDGRRPGDPEGLGACARARHRPAAGARHRARLSPAQHPHADRADGLCQPDRALRPAPGRGRLRARGRRRRASTACWWSTTRPRNARSSPRRCKSAGIDLDLPARADLDRRAHPRGGAPGQRLRVLRVAEGRHRRRPPRRVGGGAGDAAHPGARQVAGRRGFRHTRCGQRPRGGQGGRRGGHRLTLGADSGGRTARQCGRCRPPLHGRDPHRARHLRSRKRS